MSEALKGGADFESIETTSINPEMLERIFEIEQDMWARGIGEYLQCGDCNKMYSKAEIYGSEGNLDLAQNIQILTVKEIEDILGELPACPCCNGETAHVYNHDEYLPDMQDRYSREEAFLTIARSKEGEVIGFMDGYMATLEEVFENELRFHFTDDLLDQICEAYELHRSTKILTFSSIGTDDRNKSLQLIFSLIKKFFGKMSEGYDRVSAVYESIVNSSTYCTFVLMGAQPMQLQPESEMMRADAINPKYPTDILFDGNVVQKYNDTFSLRVRDVVRFMRSNNLTGKKA